MSVYDAWQQEIYSRVTVVTDSPLYDVPENETTVSNLVHVAYPQHILWTIFFSLLQFLALLAFIFMVVIAPRLYGLLEQLCQRFRYIFHYKGPGHEDLAARIAELVDEKERMRVSLKNVKHESCMSKEQNTKDKQTISLLNTLLREAKQPRRQDKNMISRLNNELRVAGNQLFDLDNELIKTQIQRGRAIKRAEDAEDRANLVSDYLLELHAMGATRGRTVRVGDNLCQAMAGMKFSATAYKTSMETEDSILPFKAQRNATPEKTRLEAEHSRNLADVKKRAATEKARMQEEHSKALNTAAEKSKADTTEIANLKIKMKELKAKIQEQSDGVLTRKKSKEEKLMGDLADALSDLKNLEEEKKETAANLAHALSSLQTMKLEKERVEAALTKAMSDLRGVQSDKEQISADLPKTLSELSGMQSEKDKILADYTKVQSDLSGMQSEKEKIAADLIKASSDLSGVQLEKEKIAADYKATIAEMETKAASEKKHIDENWVRAKDYTEHLERENQSLRNHICDHTFCKRQLESQNAETTEALRFRSEAYSKLRESNDAHEKTGQELSSVKRNLDALSTVHNKCKAAAQQPANASGDQVNGPQDEMDVEEPTDKSSDADDMDVDHPQQVLIDKLELAQQKIEELTAQNSKLVDVMRGNGDGADVDGDNPSAATEERIRIIVLDESKEERGALLRQIEDQKDQLKKKDEALKNNNVSQRLQDELKAAKEKASKLEYDLSTLHKDSKSKPSTSSTAPMQTGVGLQKGPSSHGVQANEIIQKLKFDLKRLNKESKDAKANYDRVDKVLFKRDPKACEDLRNVEKVRSELGAEIERLEKKIEGLEAGIQEHPPPASNTLVPGPSGQGNGSASGKRAWDGEGDVGGEAAKRLKE